MSFIAKRGISTLIPPKVCPPAYRLNKCSIADWNTGCLALRTYSLASFMRRTTPAIPPHCEDCYVESNLAARGIENADKLCRPLAPRRMPHAWSVSATFTPDSPAALPPRSSPPASSDATRPATSARTHRRCVSRHSVLYVLDSLLLGGFWSIAPP